MARAIGIQRHPFLKLGKAPVKKDRRNFLFAALVKAPPRLPAEYDFDLKHHGVPTPMFGNDKFGDCVMAGRAHQTLRFELVEQRRLIQISDSQVLREYLKETGGSDTGLVVLDSLNEWRKRGWICGSNGGRRCYKIRAFTQLSPTSRQQIRQAIYLDVGVGFGLNLPSAAQDQFAAGKPWDAVAGHDGVPGSWGGHYVYVPGYTRQGPVCVTWGRKQQMTWAFVTKYCDEAYAIIDAVDTAKKRKALDLAKLQRMLKAVA